MVPDGRGRGGKTRLWEERGSCERCVIATPNVRGNAGPAEGRQARRKDDKQSLEPGLVDCRWASR